VTHAKPPECRASYWSKDNPLCLFENTENGVVWHLTYKCIGQFPFSGTVTRQTYWQMPRHNARAWNIWTKTIMVRSKR